VHDLTAAEISGRLRPGRMATGAREAFGVRCIPALWIFVSLLNVG